MNKNEGYIRTYSGLKFYPLDPRPEDVRIVDIAHHLSNQCRWAGAVKTHYSVALHSMHVSMMTHKEHALAGLLHDASEAYLCDMPKPAKLGMPEYQSIEDRLQEVIAKALGFQYPFSEEVKQADQAALFLESQYFFEFDRGEILVVEPPRHCNWSFDIVGCATTQQVKEWFLQEYSRLKKLA